MDDRTAKRALQVAPDAGAPSYEVGYGKPPTHSRFRPGQSGNPRGRPKGSRNRLPALNEERLKTVVLEEAYRLIGVRDGDRPAEIPVIQAIIRGVALNAARGHQRSQRMFTELLQWVEREDKALHDEWLCAAIDYKIGWESELRRREQRGESGPEPLPHPDHIVIDLDTGQVQVLGPMTKEEKKKWDMLREHKDTLEDYVAELEKNAARRPRDRSLRKELNSMRQLRDNVEELLTEGRQF